MGGHVPRGRGRCDCNPSYEAWVYSVRGGKKLRKTFGVEKAAKAWRGEAQSAVNRGVLRAPRPSRWPRLRPSGLRVRGRRRSAPRTAIPTSRRRSVATRRRCGFACCRSSETGSRRDPASRPPGVRRTAPRCWAFRQHGPVHVAAGARYLPPRARSRRGSDEPDNRATAAKGQSWPRPVRRSCRGGGTSRCPAQRGPGAVGYGDVRGPTARRVDGAPIGRTSTLPPV
jgi:hypothetical protein